MSSSKRSRDGKAFAAMAVVSLTGASLLATWGGGHAQDYAHDRASWLVAMSDHRQIDPVIGYEAAILLMPDEPSYALKLAQIYLAAQQPDKALEALQAPENGPDDPATAVIRSKALVELNRIDEATRLPAATEELQLQQALALASGGRTQSISLNKTLMTEEGRERLARIEAGGLALAQELNVSDMPQAALRVLEGLPNNSSLKGRLVAQIKLAHPQASDQDLADALEATTLGLIVDPANLDLYRLRLEAFKRQGSKDDIAATTERIKRLESGRF